MMQLAFRLSVFILALVLSNIAFADSEPPTTPLLSVSIYSDSSAEVFWRRSVDDTVNLTYNLSRNGESVYSGDGLSYYDTSLSPGQLYIYTLTVVGEDGLISDSANIGFDTNDRFLLGQVTVLPPQGLRAEVYSSNALELFWDRVPDSALDYAIVQDGSIVGNTDGTSFYIDSGIEADGNYTFEVIAVRFDVPGIANSESSVVRVDIAERSTSTEQPLSSPQNVSLIRYSSTAAELFWDRPADVEEVVRTEIYRNGDLLGTTPGISFFDNSRSSDASYIYELVAINSEARRSDPAFLSDDNGVEPPVASFTLDETNLDSFIDNIARVVSGQVYNDLVSKAILLGQRSIEGLSLESSAPVRPPATETSIYACEGGGQLISDRPTSGAVFVLNNTMKECVLGNEVFDGFVQFESSIFGQILTMDSLQRTYPDGSETTISGTLIRPDAETLGYIRRSLSVSQYTEVNTDGTRRPVNDFVTTSIDVAGENRPGIASALFSNWTASGPFSNDLSVSATTLVEFDREDSSTDFTRGVLVMEIEDVMTVILDADNGDADSFQILIEQDDATVAYTRNWSDSNRLFMPFDFQ